MDIGIALDQEIREIYPEWDKKDKKVIWIDQKVTPSDENKLLGDFLKANPFKGIEYFFGEYLLGLVKKPDSVPKLQWENFKFCFCMAVLELHCLVTGNSIIDLIEAAYKFIYGTERKL